MAVDRSKTPSRKKKTERRETGTAGRPARRYEGSRVPHSAA
jgi:hypothetical protein